MSIIMCVCSVSIIMCVCSLSMVMCAGLKKGERHLDIGMGWGTLVNFAAKNFESQSTGVTLAENQVCM